MKPKPQSVNAPDNEKNATCKKCANQAPKKSLESHPSTQKAPKKAGRPRKVRPEGWIDPKAPRQPSISKLKKARAALKAANEPIKVPASGGISGPDFLALQNEWYAKLEASGFKDLEVRNYNTGEVMPLLNGNSLYHLGRRFCPETLRYYQRWSCYFVHNPNFTDQAKYREIVKLFCEGVSFRGIARMLEKKYEGVSLERVHSYIKLIEPKVISWNKKHPLGLDYEPDIG